LTGAGVGGWNNPPLAQNLMSTTDNVNYTISNLQITGSGGSAEFKFMVNSDWGTTYGFTSPTGFPSGVAGAGGGNIGGTAGFWNVMYNLTTGDYSFTPGVNPNAAINLTSAGAPVSLSTSNGINYASPSTTLSAGIYLFSQDGSANQWGNAAFPTGTATQGGAGVVVPAGTYNISFDKSNGDYSFLPTAVGIIGEGGPSASWGADAVMTTTDAITYTILNASINGGGMKFRDNGSWTYQFGTNGPNNTNTFPSGIAIPNGNDMLTVTGIYDITFNRTTGAYNFAPALSATSFESKKVSVYPNPSNNMFNFTSSVILTSVQIVDVTGKTVLNVNANGTNVAVNAANLSTGIYFAKVASANNVQTIKLIKN
jgi:hypothetical protein